VEGCDNFNIDRWRTQDDWQSARRFEQVVKPCFFQRWCGLYQLDIALQAFFKAIMNKEFYSLLTGLILYYLQRQQNLINKMKTKAKKVTDA
jgi:hypothetical protein